MSIQISEEQRQALQQHRDEPVEVVDPQTQRAYVLLPREEYDRMHMEPDTATRALQEGEATTDQVPPGIRCSQEAFWRELPELLPKASRKRRWVAYHGDERIGFGRTETELYQECYRRGLSEDEICIGRLRPVELAPWETDVGEVAWYDYEDDLDDQDS